MSDGEITNMTKRGSYMRYSLSQSAPFGFLHGLWARAGMIALAAGVAGTLGSTVSLAAGGNDTSTGAASTDKPKSDVLTEIVVTARKRSENVQDIPASIAVISDTLIKEARLKQ